MLQPRSLHRPYSNQTLIYNWQEERADIKNERIQKPLPSQYDHYFPTTYECAYGTIRGDPPRPEVRNLELPRNYAFPGHQPEFDFPEMKASVNTYVTEYRAGYCRNCQRPLAPDDPAWSTTTKVCLHCKDRTYSIDPKPEPYTLTVDYRQDPAAKNRCLACMEINTGVKMI
ncbi:unnamed protein product [Rotaria sp. Silwood1]|nr:unnamed protein product [Rotaria sp. Silwood1]CAF1051275.1 unnamed protein product [Rotaria sp. Silwood1]CAF1156641.1 unnamed protein product [Rotaria sp. Silwood1]CAF3422896.1 unnamed protein product [Rotaria sp. Silwood1]CAF3430292.1 unnamed protein product [Rotaria sp. Silwood1]